MREVIDKEWSITSVATSHDLAPQTVGNWVAKYKKEHGSEEARQVAAEAVEVARLKKQVRELQQENEFLKSGSLLRVGTAVSRKYDFINREEDDYPISSMRHWSGISR
ncbi:transposase [Actinomyces bowdenii]|uniref:Transposase n=1 Tax=Actinomyces bowdenii TaxID=131109 RepID=A0A853ELL6_9ACTO|nr:transposase [Actinomyces bowdenii]NYS69112.1 transposase [Actinomyces bowdenii]